MITLPKIQYITRDDERLSHSEQARLMYSKGIEWVQIRMKNNSKEEITNEAKKALSSARDYNGKLIINDSIEIAETIGAHGIHLGLKDSSIADARAQLGPNYIIGGTANTLEDIMLQIQRGANYIGLGPFRFTTTKKNLSPVLALNGYKDIAQELKKLEIEIPVTAVGGITMDDIDSILATGMQGVAISGALLEYYRNN